MYQIDTRSSGKSPFFRLLFLFLPILVNSTSVSGLICSPNKLKRYKDIVQKVNVVGFEDNRVKLTDYAKNNNLDINLFSGVGILGCGNDTKSFKPIDGGTASLVGCQNVIATAGHIFFDKNCSPKRYKFCRLYFKRNGQEKNIPIDLKSLKTGDCNVNDTDNDWAVLNLNQMASSNYHAFDLPTEAFKIDFVTNLVQVSGWSTDFNNNGEDPRYASECSGGSMYYAESFAHQCDTGRGSSGAPMFKKEEVGKKIFAIHTGSDEDYNYATPVRGQLLNALKTACGK